MGTRVGRYELVRLLGTGNYAKVRLATNTETGEQVAIKVLDKEKALKMVKQIKREISTMRLLRHPNIVQLYEVFASKTKIYLVMEYASGGDLFDKIVAQKRLCKNEARKYFQQLISAVQHCHSNGVYHRDLKPENLLLDSKGNLKISDFGLSALQQQAGGDGLLHTKCGTHCYVAPEVMYCSGYDGAKADIWSCGVILFLLKAGSFPFHDDSIIGMYRKIASAHYSFPKWISTACRDLIRQILRPNPAQRISIDQILEDPWFKQGYIPPAFSNELIHPQDVENVKNDMFNEANVVTESRECRAASINAFELLSMSPGLDLSGLFQKQQEKPLKQEARFTCVSPLGEIITKIEETVKPLGFAVHKQKVNLRLLVSKIGGKSHLSVAIEIFEVAPSFYVVEFKKAVGDNVEYRSFYKSFSHGLKGTLWNWESSI